MPYNKRIHMNLDQARQEIRDINAELKAKEGQQDDAVQAVVEHISKIDDDSDTIQVPSPNPNK